MDDIIKAMRVLAQEIDKKIDELLDSAFEKPDHAPSIGAAAYTMWAQSGSLANAADRLERESKNPGAEEM